MIATLQSKIIKAQLGPFIQTLDNYLERAQAAAPGSVPESLISAGKNFSQELKKWRDSL